MGKQAGRRHPFVRPLYVWATCGKVLFFLRDDLPSANPFWKCIHTSAQTYASSLILDSICIEVEMSLNTGSLEQK